MERPFVEGKPRPPPVETPFWQLQQKGRLPTLNIVGLTKEDIEKEKELDDNAVANNYFEAVSSPSPEGSSAKPMVRHVLVKDLRKVATNLKVGLPKEGLLADRASMALFAMFDGQLYMDDAIGPLAAEFCARQVHTKLLKNIAAMPTAHADEKLLRAALLKSLEDLDEDLRASQPNISQSCSAMVALMIGARVFTATFGSCGGVICLSSGAGGVVVHTLGSRQSKMLRNGRSLEANRDALLASPPEIGCFPIPWEGHPSMMFFSTLVMHRLSEAELLKVAQEFPLKPRAICGEIVAKATAAAPNKENAQCTAVVVFFRPSKTIDEFVKAEALEKAPASKKAKISAETQSIRLRHILVKHRNCGLAQDVVRNKPVLRTEAEAETMLRDALRELQQERAETKVPMDSKRAAAALLQPSPKYIKLCKELSECATAKNGGGMLGDMGWLSHKNLIAFGPTFLEVSRALQAGQWSDLVRTEHGFHIFQKIA